MSSSVSDLSDGRPAGLLDKLQGLRDLLGGITALIGSVSLSTAASAQVAAAHVSASKQIQETIDGAVQLVEQGGHQHGPNFRVVDAVPDLSQVQVSHAVLHGHQPLDVLVDVRASAQLGGLLLSFGWHEIPHTMTFQIRGNRGAKEITVVSGASFIQIVNAFYTVAPLTGVWPSFGSGWSVSLQAGQFGADQFVCVSVVNHPGIPGPTGIYRFQPHNCFQPDPTTRVAFDSLEADEGVLGQGQDLIATINGHPAVGNGPAIRFDTPRLRLEMTLDPTAWPHHALNLGPFRAFRILRD